jgi:hydrogenase nickel incorporation protein HypA/HybF
MRAPRLDSRPFFRYFEQMHEMSIATSLLSLVDEELKKRRLEKLLVVRVRHGALTNIVPEAMSFAFEALTLGGPFEGARLELEEEPLVLRCSCGARFSPERNHEPRFAPCPACGEKLGHTVEKGRELYLQHIEAE